jgi:hypothetical protein
MIECRRRFFFVELLSTIRFTIRAVITETAGHRKPLSKWSGHFILSGLLTLYYRVRSFSQMQTQTPCSDYVETKGLIYFARMLDKIRLNEAGRLAPGYFVGVEDPTFFDARCTRFLGVNYDELVERTLEGGSDEEILEWCFARGRRPSREEISIWNTFLFKRGWRDEASADLEAAKKRSGFGGRADIQTWLDLHDVEEGRIPRK